MPHDWTMVPPAGFARCAQTAFYDLAEAPSAMEDMLSRKIQGKAIKAGDARLNVEMSSRLLKKPVKEEESTHVY